MSTSIPTTLSWIGVIALMNQSVFQQAVVTAFLVIPCHLQKPLAYRTPSPTANIIPHRDEMTIMTTRWFLRTEQFLAKDDQDEEDEDDEEDSSDPLSKGIDSVSWLPSAMESTLGSGTTTKQVSNTQAKDADVLPLFPLGGIVYTPNSEHRLNIFEPRYRQMYTDILMNGTKRFVVSMSHPTEPGRFAEVGVLFELLDLKEVSEQTQDQIKYICNHKVTARVKLHRILNPEAWQTRDTYLRVEGSILVDDTPPANDVYMALVPDKEEKALRTTFSNLVEIQHDMEEDVRFTRTAVVTLAVKPGSGNDGLWQTIRLWQSFVDQRLVARQNELQRDFQEKLQNFLKKERGIKDDELPSAIGYNDLTPALQKEVKELQKRMAIELRPLVLESTLTMQKLLEAEDHTARLRLLRHFMQAETSRLQAKKTLMGMLAGADKKDDTTSTALESAAEAKAATDEKPKSSDKSTMKTDTSIFTDEPDAFQ